MVKVLGETYSNRDKKIRSQGTRCENGKKKLKTKMKIHRTPDYGLSKPKIYSSSFNLRYNL
jgi:hypothetical protein